MIGDRLAQHMHEHNYYLRSMNMADRSIRQRFPELCQWRLDLFERRYLEKLDRLSGDPAQAEGLTWTRAERKERRRLVRNLPMWRRGALRTALEIWCLQAGSQKSSQMRAIEELRSKLSSS